MVRLTEERLEIEQLVREAFHAESGAVVTFVGTVREESRDGRNLRSLAYEAYRDAAEKRIAEILEEARTRWALRKALLVHRLGEVPVGEESVLIAASSPHRKEAFAAVSWIMDTVKADVPIWKKEVWEKGEK
jgi:molybdopterin synthase catalytic subunit